MRKLLMILVMMMVAVSPASAGPEGHSPLMCKKSPAHMMVPEWVDAYLCETFGPEKTAYAKTLSVLTEYGPVLYAMLYTEPEGSNESWVATAAFEITEDGSLGRLMLFRAKDGRLHEWDGELVDPSPPTSGVFPEAGRDAVAGRRCPPCTPL